MNVLWLSWKDRGHPLAGGAESVSGEIMDRLVAEGHSVRLITSQYSGGAHTQKLATNFTTHRIGNRYTVYLKARKIFRELGAEWADVIVDEMNTLPFWVGFYSTNTTNVLLAYQLAREVWFHQMIFPFSLIGYLSEPVMLRLLTKGNYRAIATESVSSKKDLEAYGFLDVHTFRVGIRMPVLPELPQKNDTNLVLSLGAIRPMKRTLDAVKAFEHAHTTNPKLRLVVAGDDTSAYGRRVTKYIRTSPHKDAIDIRGRVSNEERLSLMREAAIILVTSIKEGWGLIVTEANSQGTPAIVYNVDGLRDSVVSGTTGVVVPNGNHAAMGDAINELISNTQEYNIYRQKAWEMSKQYTFDNSYSDFMKIISEAK